MPTLQVVPRPGQTPNIGYGSVFVDGPNLPAIQPGDAIKIYLFGQLPQQQEIGHMLPGESAFTYDGLMIGGALPAPITLTAKVPGSLANSPGLMVTNGVVPQDGNVAHGGQPGFLNPFNSIIPCQYGPPGPPPSSLPPGIDATVAAVQASWETHVPVSDVRTDLDYSITYLSIPPWSPVPIVAFVPATECLKTPAAIKVAGLFGGTVEQHPSVTWSDPFVFPAGSPQPSVNWIVVPNLKGDGVKMRAMGSALVQAFDTRQTGQMKANILATFQIA